MLSKLSQYPLMCVYYALLGISLVVLVGATYNYVNTEYIRKHRKLLDFFSKEDLKQQLKAKKVRLGNYPTAQEYSKLISLLIDGIIRVEDENWEGVVSMARSIENMCLVNEQMDAKKGKIPGNSNSRFFLKTRTFKKVALACMLGMCMSVPLKTYAQPQINKYKAETMTTEEELINAETSTVDNKKYTTGIFGSQSYRLTIKVLDPKENTYSQKKDIEVDPKLYDSKKVGDTLKVECTYQNTKDKDGKIINSSLDKIKVLE